MQEPDMLVKKGYFSFLVETNAQNWVLQQISHLQLRSFLENLQFQGRVFWNTYIYNMAANVIEFHFKFVVVTKIPKFGRGHTDPSLWSKSLEAKLHILVFYMFP